jgi:hypothetical protein
MSNFFGKDRRNKTKSTASQFMIEFKRVGKRWKLSTQSFVRIWQTSDSLEEFLNKINSASLVNHGEECYSQDYTTLKSRLSYLRNHRSIPLREHTDEDSLWNYQKSGKINWEELRDFCEKTSGE